MGRELRIAPQLLHGFSRPPVGSARQRYRNTWDCVRTLARDEGWRAFFRGSILRIVRIAPGGAVQFGVYGVVSDWLDKRG